MDAKTFIEGYIKPYLAENYPNADVVFLAGSLGRSMKNGDFAPQASSDADLVIVYRDLEKDGLKTAIKIYKMEDVGTVLKEGAPREMMIDCNVHDLASLVYHYDIVKNHSPYAFIPVMVDEGYIVLDRLGIGPSMQKQAKEFLEEGPALPAKSQWQAQMDFVRTYANDIKTANTTEEKRFLGVLAMVEFCEFALTLNCYWSSGANQAYRSFIRKFPDEGRQIEEAFSSLMRAGDSERFEKLADQYLARGAEFMKTLPDTKIPPTYDLNTHVSADETKAMNQMFYKFMAEHLCTAFEKSEKRGELAFLENLSASVRFIKKYVEQNDGVSAIEGKPAAAWLGLRVQDLMPITLQAMDEKIYQPIVDIANKEMKSIDGFEYKELVNYYIDDVARVNALNADPVTKQPKTSFKAGYKI